jgi:RecB family exonuclease
MLAAALREQSCGSLLYLIEDHPFFARAAEADHARYRERGFTRYDGLIEDAALRQEFRSWSVARWPSLISNRLEHYARCPFSFFVSRILEVQEVEEPPELQRISPYERAILMRDTLDLFYKQEKAAGRLPLRADSLPTLRDIAWQRFARFERENNTGIYLLWQIDRDRMIRAVSDFIECESRDTSGFVPELFGQNFTVSAGGDNPQTYSGRLDRLDAAPDNTARAVMYKTGKLRGKDGSLMAGQTMHLPVYLMAAEYLSGKTIVSAADYLVAAGTKLRKTEYSESDWRTGREMFLRTAAIIQRQIADGVFFPHPEKTKCATCRVREACGAGRMTAKWNYDLPETRGFRSLAEAK